ncbi:MAG TPA: LamG-like jellyroll fold domain-containing protein, partial [Methylomirabilota bacterium]|nr:LamG-like jellyroll fold domain-containing protein [Methylomirabilota bacterium]
MKPSAPIPLTPRSRRLSRPRLTTLKSGGNRRTILLALVAGLVATLPCAQAAVSCAEASANLVAWWPAEDHSYDIIGERLAVLQGDATYTVGHIGQGFLFGGAGGRVRVLEHQSTDLSRLARWTIEGWVRPASFNNAQYPTIYSEGNRIVTLGLQNGTGRLESWVNNDSNRRLVSTNALTLDAWNHVALVYDGTRRYLYLNGVLTGSTNTLPITDDSAGAAIGQSTANDSTTVFQGAVDELSLYNTNLTAAQIAAIHAAGAAGKCFGDSMAPQFVLDPVSQNGFLGGTVTLTALAAGCPVIGYQWLFNGTPLDGAASYSLTLSNLTFAHAGGYALRAINPYGSTTSAVAQVVVPWCTAPPTNLVAWWPADGSGVDAVDHHDGAVWGGTTYGPGVAGSAFSFNGTDAYAAVPDAPELSPHVGTNGEMSVEVWVKLDQLPQADAVTGQGRRVALAKGSPGQWEYGLSITTAGIPEFYAWTSAGSVVAGVTGGQILTGQWHHVVATLQKGDALKLYQDGLLVGTSTNFTGDTADGNSPLYLGRRGDAQFLKGWVDEAALYSRALTAAEVTALYAADGSGKCSGAPSPAPWFTRQPENQTGYLLLGAGLAAFANGTPRPSYQWYRSNATEWVEVPGQTNGTLVFTNLSEDIEGNYRVVAANPRGSITSESAYLKAVLHDILTGGDSFEKGWNGWITDCSPSVWEVGVAQSGPGTAHHGTTLAATVLGGNYPRYANCRLLSPPLVVPPASENPRLRFWHWYSIWGGDAGYVEVRVAGSADWVKISPDFTQSSGAWTRPSLDLSAYADQTIQIAFHFVDDGG